MFGKPGKTAPDAPAPFQLELAPPDLSAAALEAGLTGRAERFYRAGHRLMARGFYTESAQAFDHATRHDRSYYDAYVGLAEVLVLAGELPRAAGALERAMERFGLNCALGAARGHLYLHQQEPDKALECASIANQRDPEYAYAWLVAGEARLAVGGRAREYSADAFERAMTVEVAWPNLRLRIALAHLEWGNAQGAGDLLRHLIEEDPELPLAWILTGDAARLSGDPTRAEECYRRARELAPELTWLRERTGWVGRLRQTWRGLRQRFVGPVLPV